MTPDVYKKTFWRTFPLQACFCFERMQNVGFAYMMVPALKKLYTDKKDISDALKRHLAIFNTTPAVVSFIAGASIAMEEKFKKAKDNGEEVDEESINAVKTALMGPLAGIGDTVTQSLVKTVLLGIACDLSVKGNVLGPILFFVGMTIYTLGFSHYVYFMGYKQGKSSVTKLLANGKLAAVTDAMGVLGMMVLGNLIATSISLKTPLVIALGETSVVLQDVLNAILPCILPLAAVLACYKMVNKGMKPINIILVLFVVGIVGGLLGILA